ncbi:UDP-2,4-diacetamido-2,4,6-trideoxy-beta-L-altropyranose hydrolase [Halorubrum persicum]|uniref:UDP-2,4-diacetamido-2,4, 6-trideoxy-beta-L-altropyranose hydrolase n=1 Tax=Halorubrum persicum TaxID=1383844 RepID=A0A2G1WH17_9EURY|nr:UDP-2,4-diacetamido-2,4,6-trideoxy-beta-L-altropyranose hydrolase [Halorubrum persicum]PHQ38149.1 UDP-2,4-diacetamido-2,4,6-trideoxy-beta-L-altropyranose hydrolase [Halorubrum persicum]
MYVAVRADGGPEIGYGHLVRTGALSSELLARGHGVAYVTTTPAHVREVCPDGVDTVTISSREDPTPVREFTRDHADITVLDSYLADAMYQQQLREATPLVVVADDTRHRISADVLVNGNLYASDLEYNVIGSEPEWCLGPEYLLLRQEITEYASKDPPWRDPPSRAIVTMGGSDVAELTPIVIRAFEGFSLCVDAIVGPGFSIEQEAEIKEVAEDVSTDVRVVRDPNNLPERMFQADLAVATASTTTYELLALGTPIISIPVIDNQEPIANSLRDRNAATVLDRGSGQTSFRRGINEYSSNKTLRVQRRNLGKKIVDGQGTTRVLNLVSDVGI